MEAISKEMASFAIVCEYLVTQFTYYGIVYIF